MYIMLVGKITDINNGTQALNIVFTPKASNCLLINFNASKCS